MRLYREVINTPIVVLFAKVNNQIGLCFWSAGVSIGSFFDNFGINTDNRFWYLSVEESGVDLICFE